MKIAAGATILGLGGLAGYALGSNEAPTGPVASTPAAAQLKPKVRRQVVHHTIHVRRKPKATETGASPTPASAGQTTSAAPPAPAPAPAASAPAPAAVPVSQPAPEPVATATSGAASSSSQGYDDESGDRGGEVESEGGDD